jgi:hypothetical protein
MVRRRGNPFASQVKRLPHKALTRRQLRVYELKLSTCHQARHCYTANI